MTGAGIARLLDPSANRFASVLEQISLDADTINDDMIAALKKLPRLRDVGVTWVFGYGGRSELPTHCVGNAACDPRSRYFREHHLPAQSRLAGRSGMKSSIAPAIPPRRPWYRLHLSTWLALPLGLLVAALVVLPGGVGRYPTQTSRLDQSSDFDNAIVHGWPFPFLWRTPRDWGGDIARE